MVALAHIQTGPRQSPVPDFGYLFTANSVFVMMACLVLVWLSWLCWRQHRQPFLVLWMAGWLCYLAARALTMVQLDHGSAMSSPWAPIALSGASQSLYYAHVLLTMTGVWCVASSRGRRVPVKGLIAGLAAVVAITFVIAAQTQAGSMAVRMWLRVGVRCIATAVVFGASAWGLFWHGQRTRQQGPKLLALGFFGGALMFGQLAYAFTVGRYTEVAYLGAFEVLVVCAIGLGLVIWWNEGLYANAERTSQEIADRTRTMLQAQRMESVGKLASGVAHDFNNVLTVVLGNMESLLRTKDLPDAMRSSLEETRIAAVHATRITSRLLTLAKSPGGQPRVFDLNHEVRQLQPLLRNLVGLRVVLDLDLGDRELPVLLMPGQLEQILLNLVVNARDAIEGDGRITIVAHESQGDRGSEVCLVAVDSGVGMTAEVRERCGEMFFSTKGDRGTGMGLASVRSILADTRGTMHIESAPGAGTKIRITWPKAEAAGRPEEERPVVIPARPVPANVLLVEDESAVRGVTVRALEAAGYRVVAPSDPRDAAALLADASQEFDLLLTDVAMPHLTGPELARLARRVRPRLPIRFLSGFVDPEQHPDLLQHGPILAKPFSRQELLAFVSAALAGKEVAPSGASR